MRIGLTLLIGTAVLLAPAGSAEGATKGLTLQPNKVVRWSTPDSTRGDALVMTVTVDGRALDSTPINDCALWYYGRGVLVRVSDCGTHIKVRAVNLGSKKRRVYLRYHGAAT